MPKSRRLICRSRRKPARCGAAARGAGGGETPAARLSGSSRRNPAECQATSPTSQFSAVSCRTGGGGCDGESSRRIKRADSGPGEGRPDPGLDAVIDERRQLINLAYRLLGSLAEAEDAVQETYARWYAMSAEQQEAIESPGAWLTTVASRICLDLLGSARARRERYVGEWIPEPLPERRSGPACGATQRRSGRPGHPRRVGQHGLPRRSRVDDPGRAGRVHPARRLPLLLRRGGRDRRPYPGGLPPAGLVGPTPHPRVAGPRPTRAGRRPPRQGLQAGMGGQGHRRAHRPARPRRHRDRRRRRPRQRRVRPSKAASRSRATWSTSPAKVPEPA